MRIDGSYLEFGNDDDDEDGVGVGAASKKKTWGPQQLEALDEFSWWWDSGPSRRQVFRLFGLAGTGKTTLAERMACHVGGAVALCAFTGKAASVLSAKTGRAASTVHRLIYQRPEDDAPLRADARPSIASMVDLVEALGIKLHADGAVVRYTPASAVLPPRIAGEFGTRRDDLLEFLRERGRKTMRASDKADAELVEKQKEEKPPMRWVLRKPEDLADISLVILDECSMIGTALWHDLVDFGIPILAIGDPAQLPPVRETSPIVDGSDPDYMLTEIHRQAGDSGIIRLAHAIRSGRPDWATCEIGAPDVRIRRWPRPEWLLDFDQVIVGSNASRRRINAQVRGLLGHDRALFGGLPQPGEKLICLRNNTTIGVMNGEQFEVLSARPGVGPILDLTLRAWGDDEGREFQCLAAEDPFDSGDVDATTARTLGQFTYGYAITAHKSQGSQWDSVLVIDEGGVFKGEAGKWLYTATTRAAVELTICTGGPISTVLSGQPIA